MTSHILMIIESGWIIDYEHLDSRKQQSQKIAKNPTAKLGIFKTGVTNTRPGIFICAAREQLKNLQDYQSRSILGPFL